jgi:dipeptidyl-peptidase-4
MIQISTAQEQIQLEQIWKSYDFVQNRVPGFRFMNDGKHYTRLESNVIKKYDLTTGDFVEDVLNGEELAGSSGFSGKISAYKFNSDESKIIIESDSEAIYRRSSKANFYVYDRSDKIIKSVNAKGKIGYATLSPSDSHIAFVQDNNVYFQNLANGVTMAITEDGEYNKIINGSADWVYEEEFAFAKAFFWSPDGQKIAYLKFDESEVEEFTMTNYHDDLYPEYVTFKYPKVGKKNAIVSVHIYDIISGRTMKVDLDDAEEFYVPRIKWTSTTNELCVFKMNRHQNDLQLLLVNSENGRVRTMLRETNKYYIDITDNLTFLENGKQFIWTSEKSGFNHIYLYDMNGNEVNAITSGNYDVTNFYGFDPKSNGVYYQAADENPLERNIYRIGIRGKKKKKLSFANGMNSAQFSSTFDYYVLNHSTINTPTEYVVYNRKAEELRVIEDNAELRQTQLAAGVEPVEFFSITTEPGVDLNAYMIKPSNFDETKSYPVFMYLYGGPGSQQVTNGWKGQNYWWFQMLAQQGYMVVCVDNRGTGARGEEFKKMTYMQLGHYETIDQINAAKYLAEIPYVDGERIGIWGWSYGGYMSSLCLLKGNDVFSMAIAVAPVTSWKWYDTIYTERYMRTLAENEEGYEENSPIYFADRLKGDYLLMHGMGDDNVHFQNSVEMANALIAANKQFDTYYYPNRNHGIYGGVTRLHLYQKMTDFILEKL